MKLLLSPQAWRDISEIDDYSNERWGAEHAERYITALHEACRRLVVEPELGRRRPDLPPSYLAYAVGSHLIVYVVNVQQDRIDVLNVLHPAMDIAGRLRTAMLTQSRLD